ncbi:hypothetical protein [Actinomadura atramentaria]|uniref:hypothetical protein n=1 Tax=Actinomadura atramentaria TaxID=1990 RepID=UPI00036A3F30|nr:hypothetical protein [Actinomadura atramentaria]
MAIGLDFDGPVHRYSRGWDDGTIYDPPAEGAVEGVHELMKRDAVFIFTARTSLLLVGAWLIQHGIPALLDNGRHQFWNRRELVLVTNRKLPARVYIDDRAYRFTSWAQAFEELAF